MISEADQAIVEQEQLAQLLAFNFKSNLSNTFLASLLAYVQSSVLPLTVGLSWLIPLLVVNALRFSAGQYYFKHPVKEADVIHKRLNVLRAGLIVSALIWSVAGFLVNGDHYYAQRLFVAYMFSGLTAGAAIVYSIDMICALAFTMISLVPLLVAFILSGNEFLVIMGVSGFAYITFMTISIKTFNRSLINGILLRVEAEKNAEEIKQLAFYDILTGLPNRRLLLERLERSFVQSWRTGKRSAVMFIDLDHFKKLNDTLGHDMGDILLTQVADRLKASVRESDTVSRFGGDEFVVILENLSDDYQTALNEINQITKLLLANLNQSYQLVGVDYMSSPSIGVAMLGEHGRTQQELLKHADIAMYHAKKSGRNAVSIYDESMYKAVDVE
jgi:diguanylate cyclase (GGDEF)-like protein